MWTETCELLPVRHPSISIRLPRGHPMFGRRSTREGIGRDPVDAPVVPSSLTRPLLSKFIGAFFLIHLGTDTISASKSNERCVRTRARSLTWPHKRGSELSDCGAHGVELFGLGNQRKANATIDFKVKEHITRTNRGSLGKYFRYKRQ